MPTQCCIWPLTTYAYPDVCAVNQGIPIHYITPNIFIKTLACGVWNTKEGIKTDPLCTNLTLGFTRFYFIKTILWVLLKSLVSKR